MLFHENEYEVQMFSLISLLYMDCLFG
uniref:Uncharacterized protein n=1 Tax=Nelumbo nucifera TaxID=4432 RepID=A0A822Y6G2_NELNU|nr:TPA_asm: hypothetical protein HUJ06_029568 [Nelumbo nucifera]